jgi:hypothetical protein
LLLTRDRERMLEMHLPLDDTLVGRHQRHFPRETPYVGLARPFLCSFYHVNGFADTGPSLFELSKFRERACQARRKKRQPQICSD